MLRKSGNLSGPSRERTTTAELTGTVAAVCSEARHRFGKTMRSSIQLTAGYGVEGDAHYGPFVRHRYLARRNPRAPNVRQVHLIPVELFEALHATGHDVRAGDLGENITTIELDLEKLPLNTELRIGTSAAVKLTGLRTPCVLIDRFQGGLKKRLAVEAPDQPFRAGVMAIVVASGEVTSGDTIRVILPETHLPLPPL